VSWSTRECSLCGKQQQRHATAKKCLHCGGRLLSPGKTNGEEFVFPCPLRDHHVRQAVVCQTCNGTGSVTIRARSQASATRRYRALPRTLNKSNAFRRAAGRLARAESQAPQGSTV
jgi:RecJ-like exonuclease